MDRSRRVLLQYVVESWEPVVDLTTVGKEDYFPHWQAHGLERDDLAGVLGAMFTDGDMVARWRTPDEPDFVPTHDQIERALDAKNRRDGASFSYGLTAQGGRRWEEAARPDWSRYIDWRCFASPSPKMETVCADRSRAQEYLDSRPYKILSPRWEVLAPWQATYWKLLPQAHLVPYNLGEPAKTRLARTAGSLLTDYEDRYDWWKWFESPP